MYRAFPGSDYYEGSVAIGVSPRRQSRVPLTSWVGSVILHSMSWETVVGRLNPLTYQQRTSILLAGGLLILTGMSLGAGLLDWADYADQKNSLLYQTWVRALVDERWWVFGLGALFAYAVRVGLAIRVGRPPRAFVWMVPIELVVVVTLACLTALGLFWLNTQAPCIGIDYGGRDPSLFAC